MVMATSQHAYVMGSLMVEKSCQVYQIFNVARRVLLQRNFSEPAAVIEVICMFQLSKHENGV